MRILHNIHTNAGLVMICAWFLVVVLHCSTFLLISNALVSMIMFSSTHIQSAYTDWQRSIYACIGFISNIRFAAGVEEWWTVQALWRMTSVTNEDENDSPCLQQRHRIRWHRSLFALILNGLNKYEIVGWTNERNAHCLWTLYRCCCVHC